MVTILFYILVSCIVIAVFSAIGAFLVDIFYERSAYSNITPALFLTSMIAGALSVCTTILLVLFSFKSIIEMLING